MMTKTKTIKMLLYDGSLNGVTNISDSAWESGKMYSAPRESISDLIMSPDEIQSDRDIIINFFGSMEIHTAKGVLRERDFNSPKSSRVATFLLLNSKSSRTS